MARLASLLLVAVLTLVSCQGRPVVSEPSSAAIPSMQAAESTTNGTTGPTTRARDVAGTDRVAAISVHGGRFSKFRLIIGVWADGTVIWSNDRQRGGKPYFRGNVVAARLQQLLTDLEAAGFFEPNTRTSYYGPDSSYHVIEARIGRKYQALESWHEGPSTQPDLVVTDRGISIIQPGQPRPQASPEYQSFISTWARARESIWAIVPASGTEVSPRDVKLFDDSSPSAPARR
jgi:hypothetical protein